VVSHERRREVSAFISGLQTWAAERDDVVAAAIVGSWARGAAREDSDVDVVLLTEDVSVFESDGWIAELAPAAELVRIAE
jgi:predicted nucleotidyltransferase